MTQNMSFLLNVPHACEKNVYSALDEYSALKNQFPRVGSWYCSEVPISLKIFWLDGLSTLPREEY